MNPMLTDKQYAEVYNRMVLAARQCFITFLYLMFPQGMPETTYKLAPLHLFLAQKVMQAFRREGAKNRAVSVPPQHGKSRMLVVRTVAWLIGARPGISIAITGFSHSLLVDFLKEVEDLMQTPAYQRIFPGVVPRYGRNRDASKYFTNGASVVAKAAGSKLTGRRVDWLIIDDAHAGRAEAESEVLRSKVIQWFFADCKTRLSQGAQVFIIGTRWHPADLIGFLTSDEYTKQLKDAGHEEELFEVTNLRAISEEGEEDPLGRAPGEALFPEERPLRMMQALKAALPGYEWDSQYRGSPRSTMGGQVDISKLRYLDAGAVPWDYLDVARGWDLAISEKQGADYTAGALVGRHRHTGDYYIIDMFRRRMAWSKLRANMVNVSLEDRRVRNVMRVGIEGVAGFDVVFSEVRDLLLGEVQVLKKNPPKGGKLIRAQPWLNRIEGGKVWVVNGPWKKDFLEELLQFPEGSHDDQVDAVSIGFEMLEHREKLLIA